MSPNSAESHPFPTHPHHPHLNASKPLITASGAATTKLKFTTHPMLSGSRVTDTFHSITSQRSTKLLTVVW